MLPLFLLIGCEIDQGLTTFPSRSELDSAEPDTAPPIDSAPPEDTEDTDDGGGSGGNNGGGGETSEPEPRDPEAGELVISELMVNPEGVPEDTGEWIELYNGTTDDLVLTGLILGDEGVDAAEVAFSDAVVAAGDFIVLCASETENGGVDCQGTYLYQTFGGGFALSNSADEVVITSGAGVVLDSMRYSEGSAPAGQSIGAPAGCLDAASNDAASCWCPQSGSLSSGDAGTPGGSNSGC